MFKKLTVLLVSIIISVYSTVKAEEVIIFKAASGQQTEAYEGEFFVPENRNSKSSRMIPIRYVRFPSTSKNPGSPIVYLSGGPGGSGISTAKHQRFSLFMAMRQHADVIALDQRGTGKSNDTPFCESNVQIPLNRVVDDEEYFSLNGRALKECLQFWRDQDVDIYGYTTPQSALDLDDLRNHLGAKKISLWGISYGSHLALAALKSMSDQLDKVIIATVEGLDQTVKMPARTDAYFDRLQSAINTNQDLKKTLPDVKALIRRVHADLDRAPLTLEVLSKGKQVQFLLSKRDLQQMLAATISDPEGAVRMLNIYLAIEDGELDPLVEVLQMFGDVSAPIGYRAMPVAMDLASGQSESRYKKIMAESKTSLLASHLNSSVHLTGMIAGIDLGEGFRSAPISEVNTLVLRGSLDGRIYPQSQLEATEGLNNRQVVDVINGGHNLFMTSPEVAEIMHQFMQGVNVDQKKITVELPW